MTNAIVFGLSPAQLEQPKSAARYCGTAGQSLSLLTDPRSLVTRYTYDGLGDLKQLQSPDTGTTQSTFDTGGNLHTTQDARGSVATYSYDALNRPTGISYADQTVGFSYDQGPNGIGHLSQLSDGSGQTNFEYDALGRITRKRHTVSGTTLTVAYAYTNGQLTALTTPSGQIVDYAYNGSGQIAGITINGVPLLSSVSYLPFGAPQAWTWGNGTQTSRSYDLDGHITDIDSAGRSSYTFFDDGNISSRSDDSEHDYSVVAGTTTVSIAPTSNQISSTSGALVRTYAYDAAGNTTGNGTLVLGYNGAGRMSSASVGSASTTFAVNALGQRVAKVSPSGTTLFAYDEAGHLLGEYSGTGALIEETVWLGDIPVATLRPNGANGVNTFYVHTDHLDTPRRVSRPGDNAIVWRWSSDPYGNGFVDEDPDGDGQLFGYNLRFPGQYYDGETGLAYNMWRDYDPGTGRYVESDPLGIKAGVNTYAYVKGNPVSYNDATGLDPASTWGCDGNGNYVPIVNDKNSCTSGCTKAHEEVHIADAKARWGSNLCRNKPAGYIPTAPGNQPSGYDWTYKRSTECRAYKVEVACLKKLMEGCKDCKEAARARLYSAEDGVAQFCN